MIFDFPLPDGPSQTAYTKKYAYDGGGLLIYSGFAFSSNAPGPPRIGLINQSNAVTSAGPSTAAAVWAIQKFTYDGSSHITDSQWADGNTLMDNIWDNRASLSYT